MDSWCFILLLLLPSPLPPSLSLFSKHDRLMEGDERERKRERQDKSAPVFLVARVADSSWKGRRRRGSVLLFLSSFANYSPSNAPSNRRRSMYSSGKLREGKTRLPRPNQRT